MFFYLKNKIKKSLSKIEDWVFTFYTKCDFYNGTYSPICEKKIGQKFNIKQASLYEAVYCSSLRIICNKILQHNPKTSSFFDVGCGKGKALVYVGLKYSNKINSLHGIDINKNLVLTAKKNIKKCNLKASISVEDASKTRIDIKNCIIFLFNPFTKKILYKFVQNNKKNFQKNKTYLAYINNVERNVLINLKIKEIYNNKNGISIFEF